MPDTVQTAMPAFVGYTETATIDGKPAYMTPVQIGSLPDYEAVFGGSFRPTYGITEAAANSVAFAAQHWDAAAGAYVVKQYALSPLGAFTLYNSVRLFYANGGGTCYVCSVGRYVDGVSGIDKTKLGDGLTAVGAQVGPTLLAIPEAVSLPSVGDFTDITRQMLAQCATLGDRVAILDVYGTDTLDPAQPTYGVDLDAVIDAFHACVGDTALDYGAAYFPFLVTSIVQPGEIDFTDLHVTGADNAWALLQTILTDQAAYLHPGKDPGPTGDEDPTFTKIKGWIDQIPPTTDSGAVKKLNRDLVAALPLLGQMEHSIVNRMNLLPPSGAIAGVCTVVDATRGVWNAPANIALNSVLQPNVAINDDRHASINVPVDGKSINVIREFVGRGPVVWGARTLDGNSSDWRYVQVRRAIVYIETSIKRALNAFVFAPNDGKTWMAVIESVSGFLANLWSQGGLVGDKASDAFTVACGLGSTMTGTDIVDGYMIVLVTVQVTRPGEFIELTFKQPMQATAGRA
jgi:Bacteriophage tail sheath protein